MFRFSSVEGTRIYFVAKDLEIAWVTLRMILQAADLPMQNAFATFLNLPSSDK